MGRIIPWYSSGCCLGRKAGASDHRDRATIPGQPCGCRTGYSLYGLNSVPVRVSIIQSGCIRKSLGLPHPHRIEFVTTRTLPHLAQLSVYRSYSATLGTHRQSSFCDNVDSIAEPQLQPTMLPLWHRFLDDLTLDVFTSRLCFWKFQELL